MFSALGFFGNVREVGTEVDSPLNNSVFDYNPKPSPTDLLLPEPSIPTAPLQTYYQPISIQTPYQTIDYYQPTTQPQQVINTITPSPVETFTPVTQPTAQPVTQPLATVTPVTQPMTQPMTQPVVSTPVINTPITVTDPTTGTQIQVTPVTNPTTGVTTVTNPFTGLTTVVQPSLWDMILGLFTPSASTGVVTPTSGTAAQSTGIIADIETLYNNNTTLFWIAGVSVIGLYLITKD